MKRTLLCTALALSVVLSGCTSTPPKATPNAPSDTPPQETTPAHTVVATMPEDISIVVSGVTVKVDPMIEMLSIIQYLSSYDEQYGLITDLKTDYQDDIDLAFGQYKEHDTVKYFDEVMKTGFAFDKPPAAALYLNKDFSINEDYEGSDFAVNTMPIDMNQFRDAMEQFCVDTNFPKFFEEHKDFYTDMTAMYTAQFPKWIMTQAMETYYGKSMASYNIVLVPLFHTGGFGPSLDKPDGTHIYSVQGPYGLKDNLPYFGDAADIADLVIHEFGHSFIPINDLDNATMQGELKRSEYLMKPIQQEMAEMAYGSWSIAYEELVLRAAVIDIVVQSTGVSPHKALQIERDQNFIYIDDVYKVIGEYSKNRDKYPTFDTFVPVITDYLIQQHP